MRKRWTRWGLLGQEVCDGAGVPVGLVVDTYPFDGGELELVVEDSPELSTGRHAVEDPERAKSFWRFEEPATFANAA